MKIKQKIKSLIVNLVLVLLFFVAGIFAGYINPKIYAWALDKADIISVNNNLVVHFISVGQGDAIAINLPDGKTVLIDTGRTESNVYYTNYIKDKVLNTDYDNVIDYLIFTHADTDHTGGAMRLLQQFDVKMIVLPTIDGNTQYYQNLLEYINEENIAITKNEDFDITGYNYDFDFFIGTGGKTTNEMSRVIKLSCFNKRFLFTGDISLDIEAELIEEYGSELDCDVLKVPHHGSKYSCGEEFLEVATPEISIICCGKNPYGHPTIETIVRVLNSGSELYRTDTDGNVAVCLGEYYNLGILTGDFKTISITFNIESLIVLLNFVFLFDSIVIFAKKEKKKR